jgi:simple sugar transport system permease protein
MLELFASSLRMAVPLLFAGLGGLLCERSGVATICLEGALLAGAWTAAVVNLATGDPWLGALAAMAAGALTLSLHAALTQGAKADAIVSGVAVNLFVAGLTPILNKALYASPTNTPSIPMEQRFQPLDIPGLSSLPGIGDLLFRQSPLVYVALLLPFAVALALSRTRAGLRLVAAGEGPEALYTLGVSPRRVRAGALFVGGALTALGGAFLSTAHASQFTRDMTAGRGYIALAALIFGGWKPLPTAGACLLFALADAAQIRIQSAPEGTLFAALPVQLVQSLPYLVTLVALVLWGKRARPPAAIGQTLG